MDVPTPTQSVTLRSPSFFEGTAWYYARFRPPYPPMVFDFLVERFSLSSSTRVLDLGCGTGQIAIPLASRGIPVYAIDPDIDMLTEGIRAEDRMQVRGVAWMRGDDVAITHLPLPPFHLCTMGASFHWMDRDSILHELDRREVVGIAVLGNGSVWSGPDGGWEAVVKSVVVDFLGPERRAGGGTYSHPKDRHEVVLQRSPFRNVEKRIFSASYRWAIDDVIGLQLSTSYASPAQLGDRLDVFRQAIRDCLARLATDGTVVAEVTSEVLVATR